jgi:hypothetical protein
MKFNKWTVALAAVGVVSLASAARADEHLSQVQTALSNTTISGYVDVSAQWNLGSQNGGNTPAYAFGAGKADGFNLNAVDIAIDKPMDQSQWAAGYHVELMFGPDNPVVGSEEWAYGAIRQAYIALRTPVGNGIDWKVGVFDSPLGYESSSDPLNPNYTRSYGYTIEPTTLTGILATYKVNDVITAQAGVADSSGVGPLPFVGTVGPASFNDRNVQESKKAYLGDIALTAPDSWGWVKGATLNVGVINNDDGPTSGSRANWGTTSYYVGATVPTPVTKLKVGAAWDYLDFHNSGYIGSSDSSVWNMALYANYQATDKLSLNARGEHLEVNGLPLRADEFTATAQYSLWANVLSRVEFRWDHVEHIGFGGSNRAFGFDNSAYDLSGARIHDNAFMLALNLIYQF